MKYCEFCGKELRNSEKCTCAEALQKAKKLRMSFMVGTCIAIALLVLILVVSLIGKATELDPSVYLGDPVFSGANTKGTASVSFDKDELVKAIMDKEYSDSLDDERFKWLEIYENYSNCIQCEYPQENLSNGDTFVVTVTATGIAAEKVKDIEITYTVEGLAEITVMDVFEDITVEYSGISGSASAVLVRPSDDGILQACRFVVEPSYDLRNGDTITVILTNEEALANQFYVVPKETSKEFEVSGLGAYATAKDLPMEAIQEIATQYAAEKQAENDAEGIPGFTYSDVKIEGIYFAKAKEDAYVHNTNELHIVISYEFHIDGEYQSTHYIPLAFEDLLSDADGNVEISREDAFGSAFFSTDLERYLAELGEDYNIEKIA